MKIIPPLLASMLILTHSAYPQSTDADLVRGLLAENLGTRSFSFSEVVHNASGKAVLPFDSNNSHHNSALQAIESAAKVVTAKLNSASSPTLGLHRINECSRKVEDLLRLELDKHPQFSCSIPVNSHGKKLRSGYPDLKLVHLASGLVLYLDPKLYEAKSRASSFRSFYFEPRNRTLKIQDDALHLLLGFAHDGNHGSWQFAQPEIVDLSKLKVRLKAEFQASNRSIYRNNAIISTGSTLKN